MPRSGPDNIWTAHHTKRKNSSYQGVGEHHHGATGVPEQPAHLPEGEQCHHQDQHEAHEGKQGQRQRQGLSWKQKDRN